MIFSLSKILWFFLQPSSLLIVIFVIGFGLYWLKYRVLGMRLLAGAAVVYALFGLSPIYNALMLTLESQYERPNLASAPAPDGIIVLGGVINTLVSEAGGEIGLNEAAERMTEAAALARRFPKSKLLITGGDGALVYRGDAEANVAKRFFTRLGIAPGRILIEPRSRNTWENAQYTRDLLGERPGERWLLVTSAFHMPRAMGTFRAVGLDVGFLACVGAGAAVGGCLSALLHRQHPRLDAAGGRCNRMVDASRPCAALWPQHYPGGVLLNPAHTGHLLARCLALSRPDGSRLSGLHGAAALSA